MLSVGLCAQVACVWEATARKPGNVHRFCDFDDTTYLDFLLSAAAVAPVLDAAAGHSLGETVLRAVQATRAVVPSNTNLGIILLLTPLAAVPPEEDLRAGVERILERLDVADARWVYQAIRLARPGGLGEAPRQDVRDEPTQGLRAVMALAADRDLIARQYADGFRVVFEEGEPALRAGLQRAGTLEGAIIFCHLHLLATFPDSLIRRKRGAAEAEEAARRARRVLDAGWPQDSAAAPALAELDAWLRAEGRQRNPGTTADLVTASLFVALRTATIQLPSQLPWTAGADHG
jgi:triphosphoribosyl-dephospho-CoA synthase